MKLYHGTTNKLRRDILREGIKPRALTGGKGQWENAPSREGHVYLTTTYAPYFAVQAMTDIQKDKMLLIEVDSDRLEKRNLYPDEDFVEQFARMRDEYDKNKTMLERTAAVDVEAERGRWHQSIRGLGNCSHRGIIEPWQITRMAIVGLKHQFAVAHASIDPTISIHNHQYCGEKYRQLIAWVFGDREMLPDALDGGIVDLMDPLARRSEERKEGSIKRCVAYSQKFRELSRLRMGITVFDVNRGQ